MTYRGQVKNGVIVIEGSPALPDGTVVRVEPLDERDFGHATKSRLFQAGEHARDTGIPDLAINHDHYLHGHLRRADSA